MQDGVILVLGNHWKKNSRVIKGKTLDFNSQNCYLRSENRLLVTLGLNNIVVETADAILIANKENSDYLKTIVSELDSKGYKEVYYTRKFTGHGVHTFP